MKRTILILRPLALVGYMFAFVAIGHAQQRTFVSGTGNDANDCLRPTPCRNFQRAHDVVLAGGEVVALDSAGYGRLVITKSVTISGEGVRAAVTATSTNGVTINTPGVKVTLRHLDVTRSGAAGNSGISAQQFTTLHVESCTVNGFSTGILVLAASGAREVFIKDTISRNNTGLGANSYGIFIGNFGNASDLTTATIERTQSVNNEGIGIIVTGSMVVATVRKSLSSGNGDDGFFVFQSGAQLSIESCVSSNNAGDGVESNTTIGVPLVRVSNSTVTNNTGAGFRNTNANFQTRGNNTVRGNAGGNVVGVLTADPGT